MEGYRMVPSNLKVRLKFGLCSNCSPKIRWVLACSCSQNFCKCSHARILVKMSCSVSIILKTKTDTGNLVFRQGNWDTFGKHLRARTSGKMLPRSVDLYWNWPAWVQSQAAGWPYPKHFACKGGLSLTLFKGNLLACEQGLSRKASDPV